MVDALTEEGDEGRGVAAICFGEVPSNLRSGDLRMGQPCQVNPDNSLINVSESRRWEVKHLSTNRKREQ